VINSPKGTNNTVNPLFGTSLYDLKVPEMPAAADLAARDGLRLLSPATALVSVAESFFLGIRSRHRSCSRSSPTHRTCCGCC